MCQSLYNSIKLLSEEEGESLHNAFNMENRLLLSVKSKGESMKLSVKRHCIRSQSDKELLAPKRRLCTCSEGGQRKIRVF